MESISRKIVNSMMQKDAFSKWLGIKILKVGEGCCELQLTVREEMLNGFEILHGGISYALADSALAFACNGHGKKAVSVETSISHLHPCKLGDQIKAVAKEKHVSNKIGHYEITLTNQDEKQIGIFKGIVYRTSKEWEVA